MVQKQPSAVRRDFDPRIVETLEFLEAERQDERRIESDDFRGKCVVSFKNDWQQPNAVFKELEALGRQITEVQKVVFKSNKMVER